MSSRELKADREDEVPGPPCGLIARDRISLVGYPSNDLLNVTTDAIREIDAASSARSTRAPSGTRYRTGRGLGPRAPGRATTAVLYHPDPPRRAGRDHDG